MKDIIKIDNAFSPTLYENIYLSLHHKDFAWFYSKNVVLDSLPPSPGFANSVYEYNNLGHNVAVLIQAGFFKIIDDLNWKIASLHRIRAGLLIQSKEREIHHPHIDRTDNHHTALFYFSTCDAPTILYNKLYEPNYRKDIIEYYKKIEEEVKVEATIPCVENTAVIFNGFRYHSSSSPTNIDRRIVVTINFTIE